MRLSGTWADLEEAWGVYIQMEATGWQFLPCAGGLLDQPELLWTNVTRIATRANQLKKDRAPDATQH